MLLAEWSHDEEIQRSCFWKANDWALVKSMHPSFAHTKELEEAQLPLNWEGKSMQEETSASFVQMFDPKFAAILYNHW